jgi:hypothetical protein|tara:strand:+ start:355 stop:942 length:588 start_codon:yes stop_codon:yes gene_type:complete
MASTIKPDNGQLLIKSIKDLDLNALSSADASLHVQGGGWVGGHLYVAGTLVANGDVITLGNASGSVTFNANVDSDVVPSTTATYDLGSAAKVWKQVHIQSVNISPKVETTLITPDATLSAIDASTNVALALADGIEGQSKIITVKSTPAGNVTVTPTNGAGFTSITFTAQGDTASLIFIGGNWNIVSHFRSSVTV